MFHWICPECGSEIPPAVKECPRCEPGNAAASTPASAPPAETPAAAGAAAVLPVETPAAPPKLPSVPEPVRQLLAAIPAVEPLPPIYGPEFKGVEPAPASAAEPAAQLAVPSESAPVAPAAEPRRPAAPEPVSARTVEMARPMIEAQTVPPAPAEPPELPQIPPPMDPALIAELSSVRPIPSAGSPQGTAAAVEMAPALESREPAIPAEAPPPFAVLPPPQTPIEPPPMLSPVAGYAATIKASETEAILLTKGEHGPVNGVPQPDLIPAPVEPSHAAPPALPQPSLPAPAPIETAPEPLIEARVEAPVRTMDSAAMPIALPVPAAGQNLAAATRALEITTEEMVAPPEALVQRSAGPAEGRLPADHSAGSPNAAPRSADLSVPPQTGEAVPEAVPDPIPAGLSAFPLLGVEQVTRQGPVEESAAEQLLIQQRVVEARILERTIEQSVPPSPAAKEAVPELAPEPSLAGFRAHPLIAPVRSKPALATELTALAVSLSPVAQLPAPAISALLPEPAPPKAAERVPPGESLTPRAKAPKSTPAAVIPEAVAPRSVVRPEQTLIGPRFTTGGLQKTASTIVSSLKPAEVMRRVLKAETHPKVTLPGPSLPPQLTSFAHAGLSVVPGYQPRTRKSGAGDWLLSLALTGFLLAVGVGALTYLSSNSTASAEPAPPTVQPATVQTSSSPLSRLVEVTGFRLVVDLNKKSEIRYLVVNHSGADLGGITIYVTLHAAGAKPGQPPLSRFSFRAPDLGPYESKEMASPIEKLPKTVALPEWSDLRADIEIGQ